MVRERRTLFRLGCHPRSQKTEPIEDRGIHRYVWWSTPALTPLPYPAPETRSRTDSCSVSGTAKSTRSVRVGIAGPRCILFGRARWSPQATGVGCRDSCFGLRGVGLLGGRRLSWLSSHDVVVGWRGGQVSSGWSRTPARRGFRTWRGLDHVGEVRKSIVLVSFRCSSPSRLLMSSNCIGVGGGRGWAGFIGAPVLQRWLAVPHRLILEFSAVLVGPVERCHGRRSRPGVR